MSMFSIHYIIRLKGSKDPELYWYGNSIEDFRPISYGSWPIQFYNKSSAKQVMEGLLSSRMCDIIEDE